MLKTCRFLWVVFQLDSLCAEIADDAILKALQCLPKDLPGTFDRILRRLNQRKATNPEVCHKIFALVAAAQRPLTLDELREAMSVVPGDTDWDPRRLVNDMQIAISGCGSLLLVDEEDSTVRFTHHSVRQYILSVSQDPDVAPYHIHASQADLVMGEVCVTYLNMGIFDTQIAKVSDRISLNPQDITASVVEMTFSHTSVSKMALKLLGNKKTAGVNLEAQLKEVANEMRAFHEETPQKHTFLAYATEFWLSHSKRFERNEQVAYDLWLRLLDNRVTVVTLPWAPEHWSHLGERFLAWTIDNEHWALFCKVKEQLPHTRRVPETTPTPSIVLLNLLLRKGEQFKKLDGQLYCHLLTLPDSFADRTFLDPLLEEYAQSYRGWGNTSPPLAWITKVKVPEESAKLLLALKDIALAGEKEAQMLVLMTAAEQGWSDVVKLLLDVLSIAMEPKDDRHVTLLLSAARTGQTEIVEQLLGRADVDINSRNADGLTALSLAAQHGHAKVVELLLTRDGVDTNSKSDIGLAGKEGSGKTALSLALQGRHEEIALLLLSRKDVNVNSQDNEGVTTLSLALRHHHSEIVQLLLNRQDININIRDNEGKTALHCAVLANDVQALRKLLERQEVIVNAKTRQLETALHLACSGSSRSLDMMKALLQQENIDVNIQDAEGRTPLHNTVENGTAEQVNLLLTRMDIDARITKGEAHTLAYLASKNPRIDDALAGRLRGLGDHGLFKLKRREEWHIRLFND